MSGVVGVAGHQVVALGRQVDAPVDEPVQELVEPEQDRGDGEPEPQERERAAGRAGGEEAAAATGPLAERDDRRRAVLEVLAHHGYEPALHDGGEVALVNCPFHRLAEDHRTLVCGMNLDFLDGLLEGSGSAGELDARLAPEPGYCCVRIAAA
jgi:predicted ArsR family transcriptional regulator